MSLYGYYKSNYALLIEKIQLYSNFYQETNQINNGEREKYTESCFLGFKNNGNTCFINTIIISLINLKSIADTILDARTYYNSILAVPEYDLFNSFVSIFYEYYNENACQSKVDKSMSLFLNAFYFYFKTQFKIYRQEDANEFMTTLFDLIDDVFGELDTITTFVSSNDYGLQKGLFIDRLFHMNIINQFKCLDKNHTQTSEESQMMLILDIINCSSLEEAIDLYFRTVQLNNRDNLYFCPQCFNNVSAEKNSKILNLPKTLIIYLKRFNPDVSCFEKKTFKNLF